MQRFLPLLTSCLLLAGCTVTQQLSIGQADGDHVATSYVQTTPFFVDVAGDFDTFSDPDDPEISVDRLMEELADSFRKGNGVHDLELHKRGDGSYMLFFTFHDVARLLEDLGSSKDQDILTLSGKTLRLHLSIDNYPELEKVIPLLASEDFKPFGPLFNQGISEEEYLEMLSFMLGDEAPEEVRKSTITLQIETPTPLVAVEHMHQEGEKQASFSFKLIDLLLLATPLDASVSWK